MDTCSQLSSGVGAVPSSSHFSTDTNLAKLANFASVGDALYTSEISDESVSATSTVSSMSSDYPSSSGYDMLDTNSQWNQYLEASQPHSNRNNSLPATNSSQPFTPNMNENDFITTWGNSVPLPITPTPTSSAVATLGNFMENSLFWPFPLQGRPVFPTGNAFLDAGFDLF